MLCNLCPRKCNTDRSKTGGFCGAKKLKVACVMRHQWEEPIISGKNGSGAIFFSHCSLKCCFCQNYQISHEGLGEEISIKKLTQIFKTLEESGVENINLVTPSHYTNEIIAALKIYRPKIPIVWNSCGFEDEQTIKLVAPYVDIFLPDLKYFSDQLALAYSKAPNYFSIATKAILQMRKNQPIDIIENGVMKKGLIIRHMILPSFASDSLKILQWICDNLGNKTIVSLMSQYFPCYKALPPIDRKLRPIEYKLVVSKAKALGFSNAFVQDFDSASECFVPKFSSKIDLSLVKDSL